MSDREADHRADLEAVRATLRWGVRLTLVVAAAGLLYGIFAPDVGHRAFVIAAFGSAVPCALGVRLV